MFNTPPDPSLVSFSTFAYRALLAFYPKRFKQEYGPHMVQLFRDCCLRAYRRSGPTGLPALWALTLFDWVKTVIEEHLQRDTAMTRARLVRLSGWGMILAAAAILLAQLADASWIRMTFYRLAGPPATSAEYVFYQTASENVVTYIGVVGIFLLVFGVAGLRLAYGYRVGWFGGLSLTLSMVGGGIAIAGSLGLPFFEASWALFAAGLAAQFGFLALFGIPVLRRHLFPRWNGTPLLAGFWFPSWLVISLFYEVATGGASLEMPGWLDTTMIWTISGSLVLLGYVLQSDGVLEKRQSH